MISETEVWIGISQLMMTIFTMVMEKKGSGCRGTLTRTAVSMKMTMISSRLPITRSLWGILSGRKRNIVPDIQLSLWYTADIWILFGWCQQCWRTYSEWRKELRQVQMRSGSIAHSVITLLNLASRTLRCSSAASVSLAEELTSEESFRRLVKYWRERQTVTGICFCFFTKELVKEYLCQHIYATTLLLFMWYI